MSEVLDVKTTWAALILGAVDEVKKRLSATLPDGQKLDQIVASLEADVAMKRQKARQIGGQMRALADPETRDLEPLEALKARRVKLVALGGKFVDQPDAAKKLTAIQDEIRGLDALIETNQATHDTLAEAYEVAKSNYQAGLVALEKVRGQGKAVLAAIAAHNDAQEMRDAARDTKAVDASFVDDLTAELKMVRAEGRSDQDLDDDLDATKDFDVNAALRADDDGAIDESLMSEFKAAAPKKAA